MINKSDQVFLTDQENVRIGDLGLAKMLSNTVDGASTFCGTPRCLAPEVCNGERASEKADMWALGVILYELCHESHLGPFDDAKTPVALFNLIINKECLPPPDSLN